MKKLITILVALTVLPGCVSTEYVDMIKEQYSASLASVNVGNTYIDMITKIGYKPNSYECQANLCTATYLLDYYTKETKAFHFNGELIVSIDNKGDK